MHVSAIKISLAASLALHLGFITAFGLIAALDGVVQQADPRLTVHFVPSIASGSAEDSMRSPEEHQAVVEGEPDVFEEVGVSAVVADDLDWPEKSPRPSKSQTSAHKNLDFAEAEHADPAKPKDDPTKDVKDPATVARINPPTLSSTESSSVMVASVSRETPASAETAQINSDLDGDGGLVDARATLLVRPTYPRVSRRRGEEGTVVASVHIAPDGRSEEIRIVQSSGYGNLNRAVIKALERSTFEPARRGKIPIPAEKTITFTFRLEDPSS